METSPDTATTPSPYDERPRLVALAFRMLGTRADAEDAVQEAFARWVRLGDAERAEIRVPAAWLTRVTSRVCLDQLGSARARREAYVGEWLPEPTPASAVAAATPAADPAERAALDDTVTMALLVVLEQLTPAERVAFVLHDVFAVPYDEIAATVGRSVAACRQLAASARRRVHDVRRRQAAPQERSRVVAAFLAACSTGDVAALVALLDPDVRLVSDGGGRVSAARRPVVGADHVARFVLGIFAKHPHLVAELEGTVEPRVVLRDGERVQSVVSFGVGDGRIDDLWIVLNPDKLAGWDD